MGFGTDPIIFSLIPFSLGSIEFRVREKFRTLLGPRILSLSTGGGATDREVVEFLRRTFNQATVVDGYGATEVGCTYQSFLGFR